MELNFNENNIVYVIDTSAFIKLEATFPPENEVFWNYGKKLLT